MKSCPFSSSVEINVKKGLNVHFILGICLILRNKPKQTPKLTIIRPKDEQCLKTILICSNCNYV